MNRASTHRLERVIDQIRDDLVQDDDTGRIGIEHFGPTLMEDSRDADGELRARLQEVEVVRGRHIQVQSGPVRDTFSDLKAVLGQEDIELLQNRASLLRRPYEVKLHVPT